MIIKSLTAFVVAGLATVASAVTVNPVSATGSSSFPTYNDFFAIDQGAGSATTDWASFSQGAGSTLALDLGAVYNLTSVRAVDRVTSGGGNGGFVGGTTDFTTTYSLAAYSDATFTTIVGPTFLFSKPTPVGPTGIADFVDTESVAGLNGQFILYTVVAANGPNPGLSDISFQGSVVPEPAVWGLMIAGFAMTGLSMRRRNGSVAA